MVACFPFALDTLAICSAINNYEARPHHRVMGDVAFLAQLPQDSPFQSLAPNSLNTKQASPEQ